MKTLLSAVALAIAASPATAVHEYRIDASHTDVAFSIGFLGHPVRGRFDDVRGTISYAPGDASGSSITVVIATKSISTGSAHRDEHLRSPDFFDVARFPTIVFRSTTIVRRTRGFVMNGRLTMHGVTRDVSIPFRETQPAFADPHGSNLVFFSGRLRIARKDFGIVGGSKYNDWFDNVRSATVGDPVDVDLDVHGWDPDPLRTTRYDATMKRIDQVGIAAFTAPLATMPADSLRASFYEIEQLARALHARGKSGDAIVLLSGVTTRLDGDASSHSALARAYELANEPDAAKSHALRALAIDSLDTRALELMRRVGHVSP